MIRVKKSYLFLQGPHGPFQFQLAQLLIEAGASVQKIGFNRGDEFFWRDCESYTGFRGKSAEWDAFLSTFLVEHDITDLAVYGDVRPVHAAAIELARARGITIHCFEEGYLRPYWATYERGGVNGFSRLMDMGVPEMRTVLDKQRVDLIEAPGAVG